jgi:NAD(P)-dependent dehydrogenase (short-subunit alcohol dehydrogenase family)
MLSRLLRTSSSRAAVQRFFSSTDLKQRRLEGQVAVVCGAGNLQDEAWGIGTICAIQMARHGATVVCASRTQAKLDVVSNAIKEAGGNCITVQGDMTNEKDVEHLMRTTMDKCGRVDTVVNAGIYCAQYNGFKKLSIQNWMNSIGMNLHAQFHLLHHFVPQMVEQGSGNFVFVSTIATQNALGMGKQRLSYAAGKAGSEILTKQCGIEFAKKGIRGNVIRVGYINSPLVTRAAKGVGMDPAKLHAERDLYCPSGKQGEPIDVAHAVVFLASDEAKYVNGAEINVDGGVSACTAGR